MPKYKATDSFEDVTPNSVLGLGEIECLKQGGTIELEDLPNSLKEHLELVETKKIIKTQKTENKISKKGAK